MKFLHRHATLTMAVAASCVALAGCDNTDNGTGFSDQATVRFVNALSGTTSGSLGLTANGSAQGSGVAYQSYGACQHLTPASTTFAFGESSTALATIPAQTLEAGTRYTVVATGTATTPTYLFLNDTYTTPAAGRARLRIINAADATPLDVYVSAPGASLGTANLTSVPFDNSDATAAFIDVPDGSTQVRVTEHGSLVVLGSTSAFTLNSGDVATVVVMPATTLGGDFNLVLVPECP